MSHTTHENLIRQNAVSFQQERPSGRHGLSLTPPDYGIDFVDGQGTIQALSMPASAAPTPTNREFGGISSECIQRNGDPEWLPEANSAPLGYMKPSEYHEEHGGSDHSALDGKVWAAKIDNWPALWWEDPAQEVSGHKLQGTRSKDVIALGGDDGGYTWHHCADYSNGKCTMQQVPTAEHGSWGHRGGAAQAYAAGMNGYKNASD